MENIKQGMLQLIATFLCFIASILHKRRVVHATPFSFRTKAAVAWN